MDLTFKSNEESWETLMKENERMRTLTRHSQDLWKAQQSTLAISSCGCWIFLLIFNATIGGWAFDYCLMALGGVNLPWYVDGLCGLILAQIIVPLWLILFIMSYFVVYPIWHLTLVGG